MPFANSHRIFIKAKTGAKTKSVEKIDDNHFKVCVKEPPQENKANEAIIKVLAEYFDISKSMVDIVAGHKSKQKIVEIQL